MVETEKRKIKAKEKVVVKEPKLNCIGYPHDDPYGLIAAFKKTFGFNNNVTNKKRK